MTEITYRDPHDAPPAWWWVIFADEVVIPGTPRAPWWFNRFTSPGFRHVLALTPGESGAVILEPTWSGIDARWTPLEADQCAQASLKAGHRVLKLSKFPDCGYPLRGMITCVSVIKAAIGLKSWGVITPYQLYRELIRQGAIEVQPWDSH